MAQNGLRYMRLIFALILKYKIKAISAPAASSSISSHIDIPHEIIPESRSASDITTDCEICIGSTVDTQTAPTADAEVVSAIAVANDITIYGYLIGLVKFAWKLFIGHDITTTSVPAADVATKSDIALRYTVDAVAADSVATIKKGDIVLMRKVKVDNGQGILANVNSSGIAIISPIEAEAASAISVTTSSALMLEHNVKLTCWVESYIDEDCLVIEQAYSVDDSEENVLEVI